MGVGMVLKGILRDKKMTIKQLAENSGIPLNTLYSITKRDSERVDAVILQRIADALGMPVWRLLPAADSEPDREYERVCDAMADADLMIELVGVANPAGQDWDEYYIWHKDAEFPEEDRVVRTFRDLLQVVDQVSKDAEDHKRSYFRKRLDTELF